MIIKISRTSLYTRYSRIDTKDIGYYLDVKVLVHLSIYVTSDVSAQTLHSSRYATFPISARR